MQKEPGQETLLYWEVLGRVLELNGLLFFRLLDIKNKCVNLFIDF